MGAQGSDINGVRIGLNIGARQLITIGGQVAGSGEDPAALKLLGNPGGTGKKIESAARTGSASNVS